MTDPSTSFACAAPGVRTAELLHDGECIQAYTGTLDAISGEVRLLALSPVAPDTAAESAFERAVRDWKEASRCSGVTAVYDHGTTPRPWVAVERVDGHRLSAADLPVDVADARSLVAELAETLRQTHRAGVYHGSLTPQNVWIVPDGVRVDWAFGSVCSLVAGRDRREPYTAPELLGGERNPDERTDVFGLGAVAYYAVTGEPPRTAGAGDAAVSGPSGAAPDGTDRIPASAINPGVPAQFDAVLDAALARDPDERYATPYEFKLAVLFDSHGDAGADHSDGAETDGRPTSVDRSPSPAGDGTRSGGDDDGSAGDDGFPVSRRAALGAVGLGLAGAVGWLATAPLGGSPSGGSAPMFQYDPGNTGYASDADGPTADAEVAWTADGRQSIQPIVAEGAVFVAGDGGISAINVGDESERWSIDEDGLWSPPAVTDGRVHVVRGDRQSDEPTATLRAYDADDGTELWRSGELESGSALFSIPTLVDGTVHFSTGNRLHAVDAADGTERWRFDDRDVRGPIQAFDDQRVYAAGPGGVFAISQEDATEQWSVDLRAGIGMTAVDGSVYVARRDDDPEQQTIEAIDAENGEQRWSVPVNDWSFGPAAVGDGTLYAGADNGAVYAIDTADGTVDWRTEELELRRALEPAAVTDDTVYITEGSGAVFALDVADGSERWRIDLGEGASVPSVVDGTLYVDGGETLYALSEP